MAFYNNERETVAFNLAIPYLTRVNTILNKIYSHYIAGELPKVAHNLRRLLMEVDPWLNDTERKELSGLFIEYSNISEKKYKDKFDKAEEIERKIRFHLKRLGMLMPKLNDPRFLFQKQS